MNVMIRSDRPDPAEHQRIVAWEHGCEPNEYCWGGKDWRAEFGLRPYKIDYWVPHVTATSFRLTWEDLRKIAEHEPGLLRAPALLRQEVVERGGLTLADLLKWQAAPRPTRIGPQPVSEHGVDMLDHALQVANQELAALREENAQQRERLASFEEREAAYKRLAGLDWNQMRKFAEALGDAVEAFEGTL